MKIKNKSKRIMRYIYLGVFAMMIATSVFFYQFLYTNITESLFLDETQIVPDKKNTIDTNRFNKVMENINKKKEYNNLQIKNFIR